MRFNSKGTQLKSGLGLHLPNIPKDYWKPRTLEKETKFSQLSHYKQQWRTPKDDINKASWLGCGSFILIIQKFAEDPLNSCVLFDRWIEAVKRVTLVCWNEILEDSSICFECDPKRSLTSRVMLLVFVLMNSLIQYLDEIGICLYYKKGTK